MIKHFYKFFLYFTIVFIVGCEKDDNNFSEEIGVTEKQNENFVSLTKAKSISNNILFENPKTKQSSNKKISSIIPMKDRDENNLFYIINYQEKGFLILAADDRSIPILAYSEISSFDIDDDVLEQKAGVTEWIKFAETQIKEIRQKELSSSKEIEIAWKSYENSRKISSFKEEFLKKEDPIGGCEFESEEVTPLLETTWSQGCGYNNLLALKSCTTNACGRVYAGCVPVAIAQVMKYHEYPNNYDWNLMADSYGTNETSKLIKDIHDVTSSITYNCNATSVDAEFDVADLFKSYFGYSYASQQQTNYYQEITKNNLRQGKPVILSGSNSSSGHMWV